jgi:hypothetical protein
LTIAGSLTSSQFAKLGDFAVILEGNAFLAIFSRQLFY